MGTDFDTSGPGDSDAISSYPADERTERSQVSDYLDTEHYVGLGNNDRHKIGTHINDAARDAVITSPLDGNIAIQQGAAAAADAPRNLALSYYDGTAAAWIKLYPAFTGMVTMAAFDVATPPDGWLACDGAAVLRATYADLFTVIASAFDQQGGVAAPLGTEFRVPLIAGHGAVGLTAEKHGQAGWVRKVGTLHDLHIAGTYSDTVRRIYIIEIETAATPDTFRWSDDGGATYTSGVSITASNTLNNGLSAVFQATTGHAVGDIWTFIAEPDFLTVGNMIGVDAWKLNAVEEGLSGAVPGAGLTTPSLVLGSDLIVSSTPSATILRGTGPGAVASDVHTHTTDIDHTHPPGPIGGSATATARTNVEAFDNTPHAVVLGHLIKT